MEFKNLEDIISCLKDWEQVRDNSTEIVKYLDTAKYFTLERDRPTASNLHAYPGINPESNEFYIFIIDANDDRQSSEEALFNAITICKVNKQLGDSNQIPEEEARMRIDQWKKNANTWADSQIAHKSQTQGIFKAFNIPSSYMERNVEYTIFFGLKPDSSSPTGYDADLITSDSSRGYIDYFDTVRPVPPFDVAPQNSFYLLSMV